MRFLVILLIIGGTALASPTTDSVSLGEYLWHLQKNGKLQSFLSHLKRELGERLPPEISQDLHGRIARFSEGDFSGWERFPTLPGPRLLSTALESGRLLVGSLPEHPPATTAVASGALLDKFPRPCRANYPALPPISEHLPEIVYGHFPNREIDPCVYQDSGVLAEVLTALAANHGLRIEYDGEWYQSPQGLIGALLRSGHRITVRDERMYADFLSLGINGFSEKRREVYLRIPVWIQTGLQRAGRPLAIPVVHSHHAWTISGPHVNARLMFYLGTGGVGFFPQRSRRPLWTGYRARMERTANGWDGNASYLLSTFAGASVYYRHILHEMRTIAGRMPAQGYGYLGVCNDSNAFMAFWTNRFFPMQPGDYAFPLLRNASLDRAPRSRMERFFAQVPRDTRDMASERLLLQRVLGSYPHPLSGDGFDARLHDEMRSINSELLSK